MPCHSSRCACCIITVSPVACLLFASCGMYHRVSSVITQPALVLVHCTPLVCSIDQAQAGTQMLHTPLDKVASQPSCLVGSVSVVVFLSWVSSNV